MKRPTTWWQWLLVIAAALGIGGYLALVWLVPQLVVYAVESRVAGSLIIGQARLSFPLTLQLGSAHLLDTSSRTVASIQRITVVPDWRSVVRPGVWLDRVRLERPIMRLIRTTGGDWLVPWKTASTDLASRLTTMAKRTGWRLHVKALTVEDGTFHVVDYTTTPPFVGVIDHLDVSLGSVTLPWSHARTTFAVRGKAVGMGGHAAPLYCSGWADFALNNLQSACHLEPLPLLALDPYFQGEMKLRPYQGTMEITSRWSATDNKLDARLQIALDRFVEGDLSVRGRTIADFKKMTTPEAPQLHGEIGMAGLLNQPSSWRSALLPGDPRMERFIERLLSRGIRRVTMKLWGRPVGFNLAPATEGVMTDIASASREIADALEILAIESEPPVTPAPLESSEPTLDVPVPPATIEPLVAPAASGE